MTTTTATKTKTVVFIHGAWMTPRSWDNFKTRYEAAGYTVLAPAWPHLEGLTAAQARKGLPKAFGSMTVGQIADHYEAIIRALPDAPLLVGHSFGGLIVQILLDRGVGAAGIALDPAPIGGIIPGPVPLAAALPVIARLNGWNRDFLLTPKAFAKGFANTAPAEMQKSEYERLVVPAPGRIFYQAASWIGTFVSPRRRTAPLLITAAEKDRTVTPALSRAAYSRQKKSSARTDFVAFKRRSHFLAVEPGWEEVADYTIDWAAAL